jgi:SAM-dependent methyltransferase
MSDSDKAFTGSIPHLYDTLLVPLIFESYADDLARRLGSMKIARLLEVAAGTGVVTQALAETLDKDAAIVATDLNQAMLDRASTRSLARAVEWRQADAQALPFGDGEFDVVVCQFGVMFFPDKAKAFSEARRVLKPGGIFLFSVWDGLAENEFADAVNDTLAALFPEDPPRFAARIPHGYHDATTIERDLAQGGFRKPVRIDTVTASSRAPNARIPAVAYCQGTPWRSEIGSHGTSALEQATDAVEKGITARFGAGPVEGKIQAFVVTVEA